MKNRMLYKAEGLPVLQNRTFGTRADAVATSVGSMRLIQDGETGLIRNEAFDSRKLIYDESYQNEQAGSGAFQRHLDEVQSLLTRRYIGASLLEVGCGKGVFLERLLGSGWAATGVDPAYEGANPNVVKARFSPTLGLSADVVVLRHVLEHIDEPIDFLSQIVASNKNRGSIYIEVPSFDWICQNRAWFDVFYEHVNYFRLADLHRMFGTVLESGTLFGGQYIYAIAELASLRPLEPQSCDEVRFPEDFAATRDALDTLPDKPRALWGAASKGVIVALHLKQTGVRVDFAIDINPAKQGRYLPGSGLAVMRNVPATTTRARDRSPSR